LRCKSSDSVLLFISMFYFFRLFLLIILAHPPIPHASTNPPPHRLAVAGVLDELRGIGAIPASDRDGGVTSWLNWLFLHLRPVVWRGISRSTHAFPKALMASALHFGNVIPASPRESPSFPLQTVG